MVEVDLDIGPPLETECRGPLVGAAAEERRHGKDVAPAGAAAGDALELAELLERIDPHVRVRADADPDAAPANLLRGHEAVPEVRLGGRADADTRARLGQEVEFMGIGMRCVDDRRVRPEATRLGQKLDRPQAMLGDAFLDLPRLLVRVDVQRQALGGCVAAELLEPVPRAGADGVGGKADANPGGTHVLELRQVVGGRFLPEALDPAAPVGREQEHDLDPGLGGSLDRRVRLREPDVVELADDGVPRSEHLAVDLDVARTHLVGGQPLGQGQHGVAPAPEVGALGTPAQSALERVAVRVDEARQGKRRHDRRILSTVRQLPNALTVARLFMIPAFVGLVLASDGGHSWPAAIVFGVAGVTDQIDGWLARRWHVESRFGTIADPLADRLMIDAAVILLWNAGRLPWVALAIPARDVALVAGYKLVVDRGYDFAVNLAGKAATWLLYASLAFILVTRAGTDWPRWIFWAGFALAAVSLAGYLLKARREVRTA
jgi:CDP-diacylglycerol--glycerol-3-phosphate 3-phosphatidyltransferase